MRSDSYSMIFRRTWDSYTAIAYCISKGYWAHALDNVNKALLLIYQRYFMGKLCMLTIDASTYF